MKVLQIIDKLDVGGAERVFVNLSNLLFNEGIEVSVLTFHNSGLLQKSINKNINIIDFQRKSKISIQSSIKLAEIIKNFDIIHVHMRHVYRYVKMVAIIFNVKTKVILHDHSSNFNKTPFLLNSILRPKYYIGVSKSLLAWAVLKLKVKNNFCFLLRNTVLSIDNLKGSSIRKGAVIVGNIKPDKNQIFAIQLVAILKTELTIIGQIQDLDYYNNLKKEIKRLGLKDKITFIHNETNVQRILNNYQFAINASKRESGPLVLIEFLAQSLPFLAYNTGEVSLILNKDLPNFFINNFEKQKWVEKFHKLNKTDKDLKFIYNKYFSPNSYVKECLNIYKKILNY